MKNVIIIGAGGNIAQHVIDILTKDNTVSLTLFLRNAKKITSKTILGAQIIESDAMDYNSVKNAVKGQDIVYVNLAGNLEAMVRNIVRAMQETGVKTIIAISSIGIYDIPLRPVLIPYRKMADVIEASGLDYIILRPAWFTNVNEVDYETTLKGAPEKGAVISQKSLATLITKLIASPRQYIGQNMGVNKPDF